MNILEAKDAMLKGVRITHPEWHSNDNSMVKYWTLEDDGLMEHRITVTSERVYEIQLSYFLNEDFEILKYELPEVVPTVKRI